MHQRAEDTTMTESIDKFQMPTIAHSIVLHFKNLVVGKDDAKIADLKHVAATVEHVNFSETTNKNGKTGEDQPCIKRNSEEYKVLIPDFKSLLGEMADGIDGIDMKEIVRIQELVGKHVEDFARKLVEGAVDRDEDGNVVAIEGFQPVTGENTSFLLAAVESLGRKAGAGKQTVPAVVRDAALELFAKFLKDCEVPEKGIKIMITACKTYFSPTTIAQLPPEAIEKIKGRVEAWHDQLEDDQQIEFSVLYKRWIDKMNAALTPEELDLDIL